MLDINDIKIDINKVPEEHINSMVRGLLASMKDFFSKPENMESFEKWEAGRKMEPVNNRKCAGAAK
ncbi:hypothetical protein [Murimonas intestini]|uniref:hypothetical protein n=1 Tax=Murimonas intestini TaxID=1337051 RepID=UPI000D6AE6EC|nr:hypothetical protein [Murimonas intestini]